MAVQIPKVTSQLATKVADIIGGEVVLVGGSVRDLILGSEPKDYDFATPVLPDEVEARVKAAGRRAYIVGKRYGTIGFKLDGHFIEVTTYRSDLYDLSSRKPKVTFTTKLDEDLSRRDFTMNAIALTQAGEFIDPHNGRDDIKRRLIRSVGKPADRFNEDPLRMLRLVRFIARFGFEPDPDIVKTIQKYAYTLNRISHERISTEMDGIIVAPHAEIALQTMADLCLVSYAVPLLAVQHDFDQNSPYHKFDLWTHSVRTMCAVEPNLILRWAALLHDVGKPFVRVEKPDRSTFVHHDIVGERLVHMIAQDLRWSADRTSRVSALVRDHLSDDSPIRKADNASKGVTFPK
jgi:putative nucleotidyltransferase with HDIG domain